MPATSTRTQPNVMTNSPTPGSVTSATKAPVVPCSSDPETSAKRTATQKKPSSADTIRSTFTSTRARPSSARTAITTGTTHTARWTGPSLRSPLQPSVDALTPATSMSTIGRSVPATTSTTPTRAITAAARLRPGTRVGVTPSSDAGGRNRFLSGH